MNIKKENSANMTESASLQKFCQMISIPEFNPESESFLIWKEKFDIHLCELNINEENTQKASLLKSIGSVPYTVLHSLCSPHSPLSKTYKELCEILLMHYTLPTLVFRERKTFHMSTKSENETVASWYARVKQLALNCKFGQNLEAFVLNQFIMSLPSAIFERLCEEDEHLSLSDALRKAMIMETKITAKRAEENVNYVHRSNNDNFKGKPKAKHNEGKGKSNETEGKGKGMEKKACTHCGWRNHNSDECKYKGYDCRNCGKRGHLAKVCKSKSVNHISKLNDLNVNSITNEIDQSFSVLNVASTTTISDVYTLPVIIDGCHMNVVCDTGAPCTLIPKATYEKAINKRTLRKCKVPFVNYNGDTIEIVGEYDAMIEYRGIVKQMIVVVTNTTSPALLGRTFLRAFNFDLIQVNNINVNEQYSVLTEQIKNEFSEVFKTDLGSFNSSKVTLHLEDGSKPIFFKPRQLPLAWKEKIEQKLRNLIDLGVLEHVDSSDWGTPLVPILKPDGDIRICGDYKVTLNKCLIDVRYPLPRIDDIFAALQGGTLYTKLDLSNAYNQLHLDEESQLRCTWSTHIGLLKVKRLPFGIKTAAAIFQKTMECLFQGMQGIVVYQDDITVTGASLQEHIKNLKNVLRRLKSVGLKLNVNKCEFFKSKIRYLGFSIDENGLSKNKDRVSCVLSAPTPKNISQLRAFIGMANYYSKFVNNFAQIMSPLYKLLQKDVKFQWSDSCEKSYNKIKEQITSDQVLVHYNPDLPIVLTTDASSNAVSGILAHKFSDGLKPIAFISRALSKSEINYSTLDKEALAIVYSVMKLKQYLLGIKFILKTDHKPLLSIFGDKKGLPLMASARLQRWALILSGFQFTIEHIKGVSNEADSLSRIPQFEVIDKNDDFNYVNFIQSNSPYKLNFMSIARETRHDSILSKVCESLKFGSLQKLNKDTFGSFINKANELSVEYDCIMWGHRVVIPTKLRQQILQEFHKSHLGMVKTKMLARSYVWWPNMDLEIENLIRKCIPCQEQQPSPEKSSLIPWKTNGQIWSRIHVDFAGPIKNYYLMVVVCSYSKWVEVFKTKDITSSFTISKLQELFCRNGLVDTLVSDNGRQFTSNEFKMFMTNNGINHILTSPGHPATNGQAEIVVKTVKKSLYASMNFDKNCDFDITLNRFLMDYRNTIHCTTGESPAKLFLGRMLKTRFSLLKPPLVTEHIKQQQDKSVRNYKGNRNVSFSKGQQVMVRDYTNPNKAGWTQAVVSEKLGSRSYYCILKHNNREIKRHLNQIRNQDNVKLNENEEQNTDVDNNIHVTTSNENCDKNTKQTSPVRKLRPRKEGKVVKSIDNI